MTPIDSRLDASAIELAIRAFARSPNSGLLLTPNAAAPVVGFLNSGSLANYVPMVAAFRQGLKEAGYVEGQNVAVEYRWAEGQYDRVPVWRYWSPILRECWR